MNKTTFLLPISLLVLGGHAGTAHPAEQTPTPPSKTAPDNTGRNVRAVLPLLFKSI